MGRVAVSWWVWNSNPITTHKIFWISSTNFQFPHLKGVSEPCVSELLTYFWIPPNIILPADLWGFRLSLLPMMHVTKWKKRWSAIIGIGSQGLQWNHLPKLEDPMSGCRIILTRNPLSGRNPGFLLRLVETHLHQLMGFFLETLRRRWI